MKIPNTKKFVRDELISFTRLPPQIVDQYLSRTRPTHKAEWNLWKPTHDSDIRWFYITSRSYLFINATHRLHPNVVNDIAIGSRTLDFGGGSGNYSFELMNRQNRVQYFDINILQKTFVEFVAKKHNLPISVANHDGDCRPKLDGVFDNILALDVFEHIPDYPEYIQILAAHSQNGTKMYVYAPFETANDPTHCISGDQFIPTMNKNGFAHERDVDLQGGAKCEVFVKRSP
jgi:2-polyprenyl-3-methyl-5-hydroxy-6-metoxy-1,4-benzoquinol methylase